jgi:hypothetical protein
MLNIFKRKSLVKGQTDVFAICDIGGFADLAERVPETAFSRAHANGNNKNWNGGVKYDAALSHMRTGDLAGVPASDKLLDSIESQTYLTQAWRTRHDVVGGVPDVPAYLAGVPMNMRRRERVRIEQGPISIFASMELSGGIPADIMRKRGIAILALVRLLANSRPVELFACCSAGDAGYGAHVICRIDTAPLDLARAAHVLTAPCVTRGLGYAACGQIASDELGKSWRGTWAYDRHQIYLSNARAVLTGAIDPNAEALLIPAAHLNDPAVNNPTKWLAEMLAQYGGLESEDAA